MPIRVADLPVAKDAIGEEYVIFYSSIVDGKMWCPDCRDVENLVNHTFSGEDSPSALIVYVGDRAEWRAPSNPFRSGAWKVTGVPTIIRIRDWYRQGVEASRLVEDAIASGLSDLLKA